MANLYGVANAPGLPVAMGGGSFLPSFTVPASGVFTTVGTSPTLIAPSAGYFYCIAWGTSIIASGATPPNNLFVALSIGAGSYSGVEFGVNAIPVLANEWVFIPWMAATVVSQTAWQGAGSVVNVGFQPTGQSITHLQNSFAVLALFRAPDQ